MVHFYNTFPEGAKPSVIHPDLQIINYDDDKIIKFLKSQK